MNMSRPVLALVLLFSLSGNADAINPLPIIILLKTC